MKSITIHVVALPNLLVGSDFSQQRAVVVDTLRFTTTSAFALQAGAKSIRVVQEIPAAKEVALSLRRSGGEQQFLLCGERHCRPIDGFDLGNSPLEYTQQIVQGRDLIFSTSNGTRAVEATASFRQCLLGSMVNRASIARAIEADAHSNWTIVCSGTEGEISGEDFLTAGAVLERLSHTARIVTNDCGMIAWRMWSLVGDQQQLLSLVQSFAGAKNLLDNGYVDDIATACQLDSITVVPERRIDGTFQVLGGLP